MAIIQTSSNVLKEYNSDLKKSSERFQSDAQHICELLNRLNIVVKSKELEEMTNSLNNQINQLRYMTDDLAHVTAYIDKMYAAYEEAESRMVTSLLADLRRVEEDRKQGIMTDA